jgi:hypothetical protein
VGDLGIYLITEAAAGLNLQASDAKTVGLVDDAINALSRSGPALGRPLVDIHHRLEDQELKGTAPWLQRHDRDPDLVRLRPVALGDPAGRRRQVREVEPLVRPGDPACRAALYEIYLKERAAEESRR